VSKSPFEEIVFSAAQNDVTVGTAVIKSGRAFHAHKINKSPSVARRVTETINVDDEDDRRRRRDWTSVDHSL